MTRHTKAETFTVGLQTGGILAELEAQIQNGGDIRQPLALHSLIQNMADRTDVAGLLDVLRAWDEGAIKSDLSTIHGGTR